MKKLMILLLLSIGFAFNANASTKFTLNGGPLGNYVYTNEQNVVIPPGTIIYVDRTGHATVMQGNNATSNTMQPMVSPAPQPGSFPVNWISGPMDNLQGGTFTVQFDSGVTMTQIVNALIDLFFPGDAHVS